MEEEWLLRVGTGGVPPCAVERHENQIQGNFMGRNGPIDGQMDRSPAAFSPWIRAQEGRYVATYLRGGPTEAWSCV